jgi:hypothetical protein
VERIDYNQDLTTDTTHYQLKELIGETFLSGGEESFRLERYTRENESAEWQIDSIWSARRNTYQAVVVENNIPIIKLSFPLEDERRWDGNAMNSREYDEFKLLNLAKPLTIGNNNYEETVELIKEDALDPTTCVTDRVYKEFYARGVGLVHRVDIERDYRFYNNCQTQPIIKLGKAIEYILIDFQPVE